MKRLNKIIVCLGGVLVFSMGLNFSVQTIYAQENVAIVDEGQNGDIEEYKNVYVWKYKVVNGNLYKRKYNIVTGKWVGKCGGRHIRVPEHNVSIIDNTRSKVQ